MKLFITLIGGPLDGIYMPVNPEMPSVPTQLFIFAAEVGGWSLYANNDAASDAPVVDVYSLRRGAVSQMSSCPPDVELYRLEYVRPLTPPEVAQIKRMGKERGL